MADMYKDEYQTLRKEVETAMSELSTLESGALLTSAAVFTWLVTHTSSGVIRIGWFIPGVLVFFCILRAWSINRHLGWLGEYLKTHEAAHIQPQLRGWEHFLSDSAPGSKTPRRGFRGKMTCWFWAVLFIVSIGSSILGFIASPEAPETTKCDATEEGQASILKCNTVSSPTAVAPVMSLTNGSTRTKMLRIFPG